MKSAVFEYALAGSLDEAVELLAQHGPEAKVLAGGQSLVPMMAMRLARPSWLVNVNEIAALKGCAPGTGEASGCWVTGAGLRQVDAERHAGLAAGVPLIAQGLRWVGHVQTKNRGTVGGSLVHADPSAELPLVARVLDASLVLRRRAGSRVVAAAQFFDAPFVTAVEPDECLAEIRWPVWTGGRIGSAFEEVSIRHGDYAIVAACAQVALDEQGRCLRAVLGVGGASGTPIAVEPVASALAGTRLDESDIEAAAAAVGGHLDPTGDVHASVEYRLHLARVLCARVLRAARDRALRA
ncbi:MAG: FAD binding domain-containing protein [Pseudomonadota bacterium]|jgi:CO/xanthine dehydrogenase FAD-binding subunit